MTPFGRRGNIVARRADFSIAVRDLVNDGPETGTRDDAGVDESAKISGEYPSPALGPSRAIPYPSTALLTFGRN